MNPRLASLEKLIGGPRDGQLLRYSLGTEYLAAGDPAAAAAAFEAAIGFQADYSAAWKGLGKARQAQGELAAALAAFTQGIEVATARGDVQAAKEMKVFAKRLGNTASSLGTEGRSTTDSQ